MWHRLEASFSTLNRSPRFLFVSCILLAIAVTLALVFFAAYGQDAAGVLYQDF